MANSIPNIDFGRVFDLRDEDADVHCEGLGRLADFFGHNMAAHRHAGVFQVHLMLRGEVRLRLDELHYYARAPAFFLTPPAMTHAFVLSDDAEGHVLSVRQHVLHSLFSEDPGGMVEQRLNQAFCMELDESAPQVRRLFGYFELIRAEFSGAEAVRELNLLALARLAFVTMARLSSAAVRAMPSRDLRHVDVRIFREFNQLIEANFREHWQLSRYAQALNVTETRLNDICRRVGDLPSKRFIHDRLMQEAKRLLLFSSAPVTQIAYDLGFRDVSYFSRFFRQHAQLPPGTWRARMRGRNP
ncbi:4-hydroxyphenylacetate catabolism regulatory protein HpaA [Pusillimonas caeni]|uniref:4-hydroxyphenylacetate catabolism regulatory protein HpaA n=1 Tax=Pusillimonas caeni TaxID=1348472 RepID=UPI000E59A278|nr:4-hydroxyphenylacetate catabolism regulatory protein HpaA [Pusillimonas caeni]TFL14112.1 4-hydroxyphenylacetate catabolism regulatory protein HpaA [Pusillimonas caeni]